MSSCPSPGQDVILLITSTFKQYAFLQHKKNEFDYMF